MSIYIKRDLKEFISRRFHKSDCVCKDCAINSLIDVVTEQQKEIEDIEEHIDSIEKSLIRLNKDVWKQSYSAQRSTGDHVVDVNKMIYCECADPDIGRNCSRCSACGLEEAPAKPQEDVREKISDIVYGNLVSSIETPEEMIDKILSIVKKE